MADITSKLLKAVDLYQNDANYTISKICSECDISQSSLYRYVNKHSIIKAKVNYNNDIIDQILDEYSKTDTISLKKLGEPYGIHYTVLAKEAKKRNIPVSKGIKKPLDAVKLQKAIEYYNNGDSYLKAARKANIGQNRFRYYLKNNNLLRTTHFVQTDKVFDEHFFDVLDTEEKAYWFGFIYADGCVSCAYKETYNILRLVIEIQESDESLLTKFNQSIKGNVLIKHRTRTRFGTTSAYSSITITSKQLCNGLIQKGCIPNKTYDGHIADNIFASKELKAAFLRGYIDGDGTIRKDSKYTVNIAIKNEYNMNYIIKMINEISGVVPKIRYQKNKIGTCYSIDITNKNDYFKFLDVIYKDATIFLERKYNNYLLKLQKCRLSSNVAEELRL